MTSQGRMASGITADDPARVSRTRVFFGHPYVGANILRSYAAESGHVNVEGARTTARAWLQAIASASAR